MALALAVKHIETREVESDYDNDISVLEDIAAHLQIAGRNSQIAVADAFKKLKVPELIEGIGLQMNDG
ncbi:hypothetical protein [Shimia sp. FJ5]|uniref:hypothetical protein n=1 Tax=Shimia sp. FJ5 TaxID=3079054 RepID=UPI00293DF769|nr:hypothetical protein [Shimia sp. FJ5]MDV4144934.1 hypothetical protein [Shimia sp. FJ5]